MDGQNPKISVLMPVYNGGKYLKEAIDSILCQTFTDFELLIINDGSTDKSEETIKSYKDSRIVFANNPENKGLIFTLNRGLKMAKGKYIARMDQDDISLQNRFQEQCDFLEKNSNIALLGGWARLIDENGKTIGDKKLPLDYYEIKFNLLFRNPFIHSTIFFRKNVVEKLGGYNVKYEHAEDYELYSEMVKEYKVINLPKFFIKFRIHNDSIGQTLRTKNIQDETCKKIIFNNVNYYAKFKDNDFVIYYSSLNKKCLHFKNFIKLLKINKNIYKNFTKKERLDKEQIEKIRPIYMERNQAIIKNQFIKYSKKIPLLYNVIVFFYRLILTLYLIPRVISNCFFLRYQNNIKLHIGSGNIKIKDYINVDSLLLPNVDLVSNIKNLKYFIKKNSVSHIYASHVFEHFSHEEIKKILKLCYDLLCENGEFRISVPDMDKIVKIYYKNWKHFQISGNSPWIGLLWGGQFTKYDYHKTGFNFCWIKYLLEQIGFQEIKEYDSKKFLEKYNIIDSSLAQKPFGELISLNIIAKK